MFIKLLGLAPSIINKVTSESWQACILSYLNIQLIKASQNESNGIELQSNDNQRNPNDSLLKYTSSAIHPVHYENKSSLNELSFNVLYKITWKFQAQYYKGLLLLCLKENEYTSIYVTVTIDIWINVLFTV